MNTKAGFNPSIEHLGLPKIWTFEVVTPLHIGSGETLSYNGYDFRFDKGRLFFPDLARFFPEGGIKPKPGINWERDGIPGSPAWTDYGASPALVPNEKSGKSGDSACKTNDPDGDKETPELSLEARIASAGSFEEVGKLIGLDEKFPQKWAACKMEAHFRKLLNQNDLVNICDRLPSDWDRVKDSTIGNYWLSKKSSKASPSGASGKQSGVTAVSEERGEFGGLNELHQFIRDGFGIPYVPGSSLKGCLRTIVRAFRNEKITIGPKPFRTSSMTKDGQFNPTGDLGRLFQVRDSAMAQESLALYKINVVSKSGIGVPIYVEAALPGSRFSSSIRIDEYLGIAKAKGKLSESANPDQAWLLREESGAKGWHALRGMLKNYNEKVAAYQAAGLKRRSDKSIDDKAKNALKQAADWLNSTVLASPGDFLQLGFGSGWSSMTGIPAMFDSPKEAADCANEIANATPQYKKQLGQGGSYAEKNPFPLSFRLASTRDGWRPMGWVRITQVKEL